MRDLSLSLANEVENQLPLTKQEALVKDNDALDLSMYKNNTSYSICIIRISKIRMDEGQIHSYLDYTILLLNNFIF